MHIQANMPFPSKPTSTIENVEEETLSRSSTPTPSRARRGNPSASAVSARKEPQNIKRKTPFGAYGILIDMYEGIKYMTENNLCSEKLDDWVIFRQYLELLDSKFGFPLEKLLYVREPVGDFDLPLLVFKTNADPPDVKLPDPATQKKMREFLGTTEKPAWYVINWAVTNSAIRELQRTKREGYIKYRNGEP
ncbi:hypothetical protein CPC08DRAFT_815134 [Agrocybe pediades]|nr:hypothetical protein CPC08DRAFT_815134 [Agrocybe pediades]